MMIKAVSMWLFFVLYLFGASNGISAQLVPQFQDGDRVCFVGDSITHGGSYHSYVYLYYLTRFPDRNFQVWNKGISGDKASHVLQRFEEDIATAKPTVSTLMLGMNDIGRWLYGADKTDAASLAQQQHYIDTYKSDITKLVGRFDAIQSEVIFITPSIYDQTAVLKRKNEFGANDGLGQCADFIKESAAARTQGTVDFYSAMLAINTELQQLDPTNTIVGADRVHPDWHYGHVVMAYEFLKAQAVPQLVSKMVLNARNRSVVESMNATVSDLQSTSRAIRFTALEGALPFPQTDGIAKGLALVPFEAEMNQQILVIQDLIAGNYTLSIDAVRLGTWSAEALEQGINLATLENTPQMQQSLKVKQLNDQQMRHQGRLRSAAYVFYSSGLSQSDVDLEDTDAVTAFLDTKLKKIEGESWYGYVKTQYAEYSNVRGEEDEIHEALNQLHHELYQVNQPVAHRFTVTRND